MTSDFYNAFVRHDKDADILWQHQRWANSDHHYGLAAECALKALLLKQGIKTQEGDPSPEYKNILISFGTSTLATCKHGIAISFLKQIHSMIGTFPNVMKTKIISA